MNEKKKKKEIADTFVAWLIAQYKLNEHMRANDIFYTILWTCDMESHRFVIFNIIKMVFSYSKS